jgi:CDP-6-deoxy-D-xylo-4-hexulose-3-dehydrase
MTAPEFGSKAAKRGDEIITVAAGFPTTISGIIQNGLVPVFVDVDLETFVPDPSVIEQAIVEGKTKGIILAHPLGNPFDAQAIRDICDEYDIFFVEDGCDALGGTYNDQPLGTFGDFSTFSFYPAHQITMGEGGAVATNSLTLSRVVESFRDWGRACFCPTGCDNSCKKRFGWKLGNLPEGYDHKYTYSRIGYNLKLTDMQAALGVSQLTKIDYFVEKRRYNWKRLLDGLEKYSKFIHLPRPTKNSNPAWFGFSMVVKEIAPFSRDQLVAFLNENKIGTRLFFGGNILKQPGFMKIPHKVFGNLWNTDLIMKDAFWIGVWPGITDEMLDYVIDKFDEFMRQYA